MAISELDQAIHALHISLDSTSALLKQMDVEAMNVNEKARFYYIKADIEYKRKQHLKALVSYLESLRFAREASNKDLQRSMHLNIGRIFSFYDDNEISIQFYENSLQLTSNKEKQARLYYNLGRRFRSLKKYDEAISYFHKALERDDSEEFNSIVINAMGLTYIEMGKYKQAEKKLIECIGLNGNRTLGRAYHNLGLNYMYQGKTDQAVLNFEKALEFKPDNFITYLKLGELTKDVKMLKTAEALYADQRPRFRNIKLFYILGKLTGEMTYIDTYAQETEKFHEEREEAIRLLRSKLAGLVFESFNKQISMREEKSVLKDYILWGIFGSVVLAFMIPYIVRKRYGYLFKRDYTKIIRGG